MNFDQILLQTPNKNIFSSAPWGDVVMTLNLNNKSIYSSFDFVLFVFFYWLVTSRALPQRHSLSEKSYLWGSLNLTFGQLVRAINTPHQILAETQCFPRLTWFPLTRFICRWCACPEEEFHAASQASALTSVLEQNRCRKMPTHLAWSEQTSKRTPGKMVIRLCMLQLKHCASIKRRMAAWKKEACTFIRLHFLIILWVREEKVAWSFQAVSALSAPWV